MNARAVIYCRVSTDEQVKGYSLTTQEALCREYVKNQGLELVEVFIEKGESAKTVSRTEFNRMISFCNQKKNNISYIVAYKLDRIARNRDDYRELARMRRTAGVQFKYVTEFFDNTPAGRFMEDMFANMAHFDNDVRTERSVNGMKEAVRQGRYVWGAPLGYSNVRIEGKSNIAPNKIAPLIKKAFELIELQTHSTNQIRLALAEEGLTTRQGLPLTASHFYRIIRNPVYTGWIEKLGERHKGTFTPIISEALFEHVQAILSGNANKPMTYRSEHPDFPLRRFITNPDGRKLAGYWAQGRTKQYPYYAFTRIKGTVIRKQEMEDIFKSDLSLYEFSADDLLVLKENLLYYFKENIKDLPKERVAIETQIDELNKKASHYAENEYKGIIDAETLAIQLSTLKEERQKLQRHLEQLKDETYPVEELLSYAEQFLRNPAGFWEHLDFDLKLALQWFVHPRGMIFENRHVRTIEMCKLFKLKREIREHLFSNVTSGFPKTNTLVNQSFSSCEPYLFQTKEFWLEVLVEMEKFWKIFRK